GPFPHIGATRQSPRPLCVAAAADLQGPRVEGWSPIIATKDAVRVVHDADQQVLALVRAARGIAQAADTQFACGFRLPRFDVLALDREQAATTGQVGNDPTAWHRSIQGSVPKRWEGYQSFAVLEV